MFATNEPVVGSICARPSESVLGIGYALLIGAEQTGGLYELMNFVVPGGRGPPLHVHRNEDECFYVVDGAFDVTVDTRTCRAQPGTYVHLPRQRPHGFRNVGDTTASFLCWVMPGNLAGFFDAFKRPWPADASQPPPVNDDDVEKLLAAGQKYGIQILT